jgi:hypothetical protein
MTPRRPGPLPEPLGFGPFRFGEAVAAGVPRSRLGAPDVRHPHHGLYVPRAGREPGVIERCEWLVTLLGEHQWFSHGTAARIYGMPLPRRERSDDDLHVMTLAGAAPMRRAGVIGWESSGADLGRRMLGGLPLIDPAEVWGQLAAPHATGRGITLTREWLVAVGDYLLTGPRRDGRRHPLCTRADLEAVVARRKGKRGARALAWALERVRSPVDSPKETQLRLGLVTAGLPEPAVQVPVLTAAGLLHSDLGYPEARLLLEYQGEEHRLSRKRWLADLTRVQLLQDAGYNVMLVGADDVDAAPGRPGTGFGPIPGPGLLALSARVARALS